MHFFYELKDDRMEIYEKASVHFPPHIHKSIECIYVTKGTLELGIGETLLHMETGDFGIVFPNVIHHYQVFDSKESRAFYFLSPPSLTGAYADQLLTCQPENPVIPSDCVHPDIPYALQRLYELTEQSPDLQDKTSTSVICQAFTQIILARTFPLLTLQKRAEQPGHDIVYDTVVYMAGHFTEEELSLTKMAQDLGYSPFALSRVFSHTFHTNFNRYLNDLRLNLAVNLLENSEESITELAMESGFASMRTFNRVFGERYRMPPREYRRRGRGENDA